MEKVYILGREQIIPESKIISALLLYDGIEKEMVILLILIKEIQKIILILLENLLKT